MGAEWYVECVCGIFGLLVMMVYVDACRSKREDCQSRLFEGIFRESF